MRQRLPFVILQVLSLCSSVVRCINEPPDPIRPPRQELHLRDPRRNITCLGDRSDYGWHLDYRNERSMQELCADPLYGGSDTAPNFRGYCNEGDVFFSYNSGLQDPDTRGDVARKTLECRNRCFCNFGLPDPQQQPKTVALTRKTFTTNSLANTMHLDRRNNPMSTHAGIVTRIYYREEQYTYVVS